jgi:hypothetical protein
VAENTRNCWFWQGVAGVQSLVALLFLVAQNFAMQQMSILIPFAFRERAVYYRESTSRVRTDRLTYPMLLRSFSHADVRTFDLGHIFYPH